MLYESIFRENNNKDVYLQTFIMDKIPNMLEGEKRPAVIICPGGGYSFCSPREAENIAVWLNSNGFQAFILYYTVKSVENGDSPVENSALLDLSWAVQKVRENAEKWNVIEDKIAVLGFSAGGHLAASLSVFWNNGEIDKQLLSANGLNKPNAQILCYPVIVSGRGGHFNSFKNLLGSDESKFESRSLDKFVGKQTPPTFLWHTFEDKSVPVVNSMLFAEALNNYDIPFELHIFEKGGHGLASCKADVAGSETGVLPNTGMWQDLCIRWLKTTFEMR